MRGDSGVRGRNAHSWKPGFLSAAARRAIRTGTSEYFEGTLPLVAPGVSARLRLIFQLIHFPRMPW
jgi:hypothetical protein